MFSYLNFKSKHITATKKEIVDAYKRYLRRAGLSESYAKQVECTLDSLNDTTAWYWPNARTIFTKTRDNKFTVDGPFAKELQ